MNKLKRKNRPYTSKEVHNIIYFFYYWVTIDRMNIKNMRMKNLYTYTNTRKKKIHERKGDLWEIYEEGHFMGDSAGIEDG